MQKCSPFIVEYFNSWISDKWKSFTNRIEQYQSLLISLIGKRRNLNRTDFSAIQSVIDAALSLSKSSNKRKKIEKSKWVFILNSCIFDLDDSFSVANKPI